MEIDNLATPSGPDIYYDTAFMSVLEDHMTYLRNNASTNILSIDPMNAYKYEFDLFGLLLLHNVPKHLHWVTMRVNNYSSPNDFDRTRLTLLVPDGNIVKYIRQSHLTTRRLD